MIRHSILNPWPPENMIQIKMDTRPVNYFANAFNWCQNNCAGEWTTTADAVYFEDEQDAILFKLSHRT